MIKIYETANPAVFEMKLKEVGEERIEKICTRGKSFCLFYHEEVKKELAPKQPTKRDILLQKAKELELEFRGNISNADLEKLIDEAKEGTEE